MQKVINAIAIFSGIVSLATVRVAFYFYENKDALIEDVRTQVVQEVSKTISEVVSEVVKTPEIPKTPIEIPAIPF